MEISDTYKKKEEELKQELMDRVTLRERISCFVKVISDVGDREKESEKRGRGSLWKPQPPLLLDKGKP